MGGVISGRTLKCHKVDRLFANGASVYPELVPGLVVATEQSLAEPLGNLKMCGVFHCRADQVLLVNGGQRPGTPGTLRHL